MQEKRHKLKTIEVEGVIQIPDSISETNIVKMIEGLSDYIESKGGRGFFIHRQESFDNLFNSLGDNEHEQH